jgi:archaemetzincin
MAKLGLNILPFGKIPKEDLNTLKENLSHLFDVRILEAVSIPVGAHNKIRGQYNTPPFLNAALSHEGDRVLGVTDVDLYFEPLNFLFGQAKEKATVISLHRLRNPSKSLFTSRMIKEALHELGHTFNLSHCSNPNCVMFFSNNIYDTDRKSDNYCVKCTKRLEEKEVL